MTTTRIMTAITTTTERAMSGQLSLATTSEPAACIGATGSLRVLAAQGHRGSVAAAMPRGGRALLAQPLRFQSGNDRRTRGGALLERAEVRKSRQIEFDSRRPGRDGEQIR